VERASVEGPPIIDVSAARRASDRAGMVLDTGKTRAEADAAAVAAARQVRFVTAPAEAVA